MGTDEMYDIFNRAMDEQKESDYDAFNRATVEQQESDYDAFNRAMAESRKGEQRAKVRQDALPPLGFDPANPPPGIGVRAIVPGGAWDAPFRTRAVGAPPSATEQFMQDFTFGGKFTPPTALLVRTVGGVHYMLGDKKSGDDWMFDIAPRGLERLGERFHEIATVPAGAAQAAAKKLGLGDKAVGEFVQQWFRQLPDILAGAAGLPGIVETQQAFPEPEPTTGFGKAGALTAEAGQYFAGLAGVSRHMPGARGLTGAGAKNRMLELAARSTAAMLAAEASETDINPQRAMNTFALYFALMGTAEGFKSVLGRAMAKRGIAPAGKFMQLVAEKGWLRAAARRVPEHLLVERADDWMESVVEAGYYATTLRPEGSTWLGAFFAALPSSLFWNYVTESVGDIPRGMKLAAAKMEAKMEGRRVTKADLKKQDAEIEAVADQRRAEQATGESVERLAKRARAAEPAPVPQPTEATQAPEGPIAPVAPEIAATGEIAAAIPFEVAPTGPEAALPAPAEVEASRWQLETAALSRGGGYPEMRIAGDRDVREMTTQKRGALRKKLQALLKTKKRLVERAAIERDLERLRLARTPKARPPLPAAAEPSGRRAIPSPKRLVSEMTLLRERFLNQARGARAGAREARAEVQGFKQELYDFVTEQLPTQERGRALAMLKNVATKRQLENAMRRVSGMVDKIAQRDAQRNLRKYIKDLHPTDMRPEFRRLVEDIVVGLDPYKPTARTLKRLNSLREYLKRTEDHAVPPEVIKGLKRLEKKAITSMTAAEADAIRETLELIVQQQRLKQGIINTREERRLDATSESMTVQLDEIGAEPVDPAAVRGLQEETAGAAVQVGRSWYVGLSRMFRIMRGLDGGVSGPHVAAITRIIGAATYQERAGVNKTLRSFARFLSDQKISNAELIGRKQVINPRVAATGTEKGEIYLATLDAGKVSHLTEGNNFSEEDISDVLNSLTSQERMVADWLLDYYGREWQPIADVFLDITGKQLEQIDGYSPATFDLDVAAEPADLTRELSDELLSRAWSRARHQPEQGFVKLRTGGSQPLRLDMITNFFRNVNRFEHYKAFARATRDIQNLLRRPEWRGRVASLSNGKEILKAVDKWLDDTARIGPPERSRWDDRVLRTMRRNAVSFYLGFAPVSATRAVLSMWHSVGYNGDVHNLKHHMENLGKMVMHPVQTWAYARQLLPELTDRFTGGIERELRELADSARAYSILPTPLRKARNALSSAALFPYRVVDGFTVTIAAISHYNRASELGMDHDAAVAYAREAIESTQPMGDEKDLPGLYRGGEMAKSLATFQNMPNQEFNMMVRDMPDVWKAAKKAGIPVAGRVEKMLWMFLCTRLIPAILLSFLSRGRLPQGEEIAKDSVMYMMLPWWPVGLAISAMMRGFGDLTPVSLAAPNEAVKFGRAPSIKRGLSTIGAGTGLPISAPMRTIEGVIDLSKGDTDDFRRLLWSEWALREPPREKRQRRPRQNR